MNPQPRADLAVNGWNAPYIDEQYRRWQEDPSSVSADWDGFFRGFDLGVRTAEGPPTGEQALDHVAHTGQSKVDSLIYHYRDIGHLAASLDPLGRERPLPEQLTLGSFGLAEADLDRPFDPGHLPLPHPSPLRDIRAHLEATYCRSTGVEYMHIQDREQRRWLQRKMEPVRNQPAFTPEDQRWILSALIEADGFENFLDTRFRGKKRFGLDGGESLIPMIRALCDLGPSQGAEEFVFAMAHRGRLNVLVNILHKSYDQIFTEFDEAWGDDFVEGGGDVKYHRGYSGDVPTRDGGTVHLSLSPNPSHLEFVNSVALGRTRAKQRLRRDRERTCCVPLIIHGDAAFPGQGIVAECFNMMRLDGYTVGGAVHMVINNQIGFTTDPSDAHSGRYCTDIAKMAGAPIFHVNGDDPEACVAAARLALEFRQQFHNDVVIDMWCYRRHGHNEGDEPTFTQPLMYEAIRKHPRVVETYAARLIAAGIVEQAAYDAESALTRARMDEAQTRTRENPVEPNIPAFRSVWHGLTGAYNDDPVDTGASRDALIRVSEALGRVPDGFTLHRKLVRQWEYRRDAVRTDQPIDWALAELLAYGTLLTEGHPVRLTGQDVERGTFSHRHAVVVDQKTGAAWRPLDHVDPAQARICIHNSPLTESACLGFEYGYSLGDPNMFVIWEAQFGDFANGAQVIIDQFIASAETKWRRHSGLTLFLPHGYEGQGPEHSSARLERFLILCAGDDMQVVYPTTPAQMFHLMRRQMKRNFRKPLVVMTPKSLLRNPQAVSTTGELVSGAFRLVIDDPAVTDPRRIQRLILCTGKIWYELAAHRDQVGANDVAIVRIEQLFPLSKSFLDPIFERYGHCSDIVWAQEEPKNMGAWRHMDALLREYYDDLRIRYVGRDPNSSPAEGSTKMHAQLQERIMRNAVGIGSDRESPASARPAQPMTA
ncbi:MAG: 2-oxoglutarate dehydrogenase E1 component [Phycisphaeraceae bacterium]|nr:2-oxoglutarate dehydrogenase E1 component [Phycisphaeraceae bacterium]